MPDGQNSLWARQVWEPEGKRMVAASKMFSYIKLCCGVFHEPILLTLIKRNGVITNQRTTLKNKIHDLKDRYFIF